ncbi:MAG: NAD(P)H-dependent glycerol-3-phosphate dehydrogenase [Tissierellia bacterium]|nr:NAD(P)H-dependent glycerol-3-phosphate dehydrogenase [Tissierellia bacterium]
MEISILGGGSWATAMAHNLSFKHDVLLYVRNKEDCDNINIHHENKKYLKGYKLKENIRATQDIKQCFKNRIIVNAIPTQNIRSVLEEFSDFFPKDAVIVNLSKGIEKGSGKRISEIFEQYLTDCDYTCLSGPSHAEEVIDNKYTSVVISSKNEELARELQTIFSSDFLRIYTNTDLVGVEFGGAVKNVLALGIGMLDGLNMGDNPKAALMTRGIHEMARFCIAMGGERNTLYGLAGLGDLIVTATSNHSRNRNAGELLAQGCSIEKLENEIKMVVEGIPTAVALYEISKEKNIYMPITKVIYQILYENLSLYDAAISLMSRADKEEFDF